jgi:hypothetical protein
MSILSDRRSLREIGGVRAYLTQVGWSIWWRTQAGFQPRGLERRASGALAVAPKHRAVAAPVRSRHSSRSSV